MAPSRAAHALYRLLYIRVHTQKRYRLAIREAVPLFKSVRTQRMARTCAFYIGRSFGELGQRAAAVRWFRVAEKLGFSFGTVRRWIKKYSR